MSPASGPPAADATLVDAALRAAQHAGRDVADVSLTAVAREAGISRSTLVRRLGGTRRPLDDAVRAAGVEPGGRPPVRERALAAAAALVDADGLGGTTLERVAEDAGCSVASLHAVFGTRAGLLQAVFERHGPLPDLESALAAPATDDDLAAAVRAVYLRLLMALDRRPRLLPAVLAQTLAFPREPDTRELRRRFLPRLIGGIVAWLEVQVAAGRLRDAPRLLLAQELVAPALFHMLTRDVLRDLPAPPPLPDLEDVATELTTAFLRGAAPVATPGRLGSNSAVRPPRTALPDGDPR